jgi:hypothetical protein
MSYVPPKHQFEEKSHGVTSQKTVFFIIILFAASACPSTFAVFMGIVTTDVWRIEKTRSLFPREYNGEQEGLVIIRVDLRGQQMLNYRIGVS